MHNFTSNCDSKDALAAFILLKNETQLPQWRAQPGWVIMYKSIRKELEPEVEIFRIVQGSHKMAEERQIHDHSSKICLQLNQVLVFDGDVVIEYPLSGDGLGLLKAYKKR